MAVILPILSTFNAAGIKAAQSSLGALGKSLGRLAGPIAGALAGFNALQGAVKFAGDAITEARDLERNMAALGTVFNDLTPRMTKFVNNAYEMGLSQVEAARTSVFLGSVLKQAGFPMNEVADNTERLTVLAQDLATTFGYDTSEALTAMTALFRGEYDPIEKFGVALKQNEVNALVAAKGLGKLTGQAMLNAQQVVRMEQLFLRSADAAGAFARQSGTLFVEQKKLTAVFSNMQSAVGSQLTPALAEMMQELTPIVEDLTPKLVESFGYVGVTIGNLTPVLTSIGSVFGDVLDVVNQLAEDLTPLGNNIAAVVVVAFENLASVTERAVYWLDVIHQSLKDLNLTVDETKPAPITEWLEGLGNRLGELNLLSIAAKQFKEQVIATNDALQFAQGASMGTQSRSFGRDRNALIKRGLYNKPDATGSGSSTSGTPAKDAVAEFYKDLKDEMAKQSARLKLANLGASEAFIESVVGSGEDWKKVLASVTAKGKAGVAQLQREFNKTSAGLKAIATANEAAIKAAQDAYEEAYKAYEKQLDVYNKQKDAIEGLKKALKELTASVAPLAIVTREIGQFEQSTIDSFDGIAQTITDGLADGTLLKDAADALTKYARSEQVTIQNLMRQRDELANRRSMAQSLMEDIKSTIVGVNDISQVLANEAGDVTQTIKKMVGNVEVATSRVIKGVQGGSAELVASFTATLNKTKAFAEQLKDLRALGLDKNLYQQIVMAGVDAGGTTAKAIIDGGAGTVGELNNLFAELDSVGSSIAEQSAQVMYGAGIDVTSGLIAGLLSKEQELVDAATKLANAFTAEFNAKMSSVMPMPSAPGAPVYQAPVVATPSTLPIRLGDIKLGNFGATSAESKLAAKIIASPKATAWNTTINVTAGVGTDGKQVGQAIYSELLKFAKSNGIKV
jgi:phosphoglycolate phosphatase-like HAD superfamily hydrolase